MNKITVALISLCFSTVIQADIVISDGWVASPVGGIKNTTAFFTLTNTGDENVKVLSAHSPIAESSRFHRMEHAQGMMRMRPMKYLTVPANGQIKLDAKEVHLMMIGLKKELVQGQQEIITLELDNGQQIQQVLTVH